jgi:NAD(P)H-dependent flavin oxidoreductase YrpB (nitropropane dioxygenase family)
MIETRITQVFGLRTPIINAGMAMVARPRLAAAVSNAGGLGMLGVDVLPPEAMRGMIRATRTLTGGPFGVDLLGPLMTDAHFAVAIEEDIDLVVAFWGAPSAEQVGRLKATHTAFWMQVGSVAEALEASAIGAEAIIVQGAEAGGHNRAEASTFTLLPAVRRAVAPLPVIAAGGICDGATMAAALALGAEAVWCGTRFLASEEADAHSAYKARVIAAGVGDTLRTTLFGPEWRDAPMRVLSNAATREWAGREAEALDRCADETVATLTTPEGPLRLPRFSAYLPSTAVDGDLDQLCITAGECAGNIGAILPAGRIVEEMTRDCLACIGRLAMRMPALDSLAA